MNRLGKTLGAVCGIKKMKKDAIVKVMNSVKRLPTMSYMYPLEKTPTTANGNAQS